MVMHFFSFLSVQTLLYLIDLYSLYNINRELLLPWLIHKVV